uniref:RING-type domain-containing protein n=1 Tax=Chromera velia CCMP2878 TaxID=1169474 RepID=A0A0G4FFX0_9ALVE|eukprot:Cvel_3283.t1-p1 / transcript=Cvel_3283.t1 / gene=Cvel_3283 / organism=Chromera_velia_CCMP2878 / gene_product=hypothetical protein / transcript_product=hypothetical protein / location=Cvel_scaffold129:30487-39029(+) / protein_length=791 / sequence_SO=supercontig / SO=protein_coding / is_pseudo=false
MPREDEDDEVQALSPPREKPQVFTLPSCCICYEPLAKDLAACKRCGCVFHDSCIKQWLHKGTLKCVHCCMPIPADRVSDYIMAFRFEVKEKSNLPSSTSPILDNCGGGGLGGGTGTGGDPAQFMELRKRLHEQKVAAEDEKTRRNAIEENLQLKLKSEKERRKTALKELHAEVRKREELETEKNNLNLKIKQKEEMLFHLENIDRIKDLIKTRTEAEAEEIRKIVSRKGDDTDEALTHLWRMNDKTSREYEEISRREEKTNKKVQTLKEREMNWKREKQKLVAENDRLNTEAEHWKKTAGLQRREKEALERKHSKLIRQNSAGGPPHHHNGLAEMGGRGRENGYPHGTGTGGIDQQQGEQRDGGLGLDISCDYGFADKRGKRGGEGVGALGRPGGFRNDISSKKQRVGPAAGAPPPPPFDLWRGEEGFRAKPARGVNGPGEGLGGVASPRHPLGARGNGGNQTERGEGGQSSSSSSAFGGVGRGGFASEEGEGDFDGSPEAADEADRALDAQLMSDGEDEGGRGRPGGAGEVIGSPSRGAAMTEFVGDDSEMRDQTEDPEVFFDTQSARQAGAEMEGTYEGEISPGKENGFPSWGADLPGDGTAPSLSLSASLGAEDAAFFGETLLNPPKQSKPKKNDKTHHEEMGTDGMSTMMMTDSPPSSFYPTSGAVFGETDEAALSQSCESNNSNSFRHTQTQVQEGLREREGGWFQSRRNDLSQGGGASASSHSSHPKVPWELLKGSGGAGTQQKASKGIGKGAGGGSRGPQKGGGGGAPKGKQTTMDFFMKGKGK